MNINLSDSAVQALIERALVHTNKEIQQTPVSGSQTKIVVLQRGWVCVGKYSKEGNEGVLTDASVIRIWGTSKGIGELAQNGPLSNTKLDPCGLVRFNELSTVLIIDCNDEKWN